MSSKQTLCYSNTVKYDESRCSKRHNNCVSKLLYILPYNINTTMNQHGVSIYSSLRLLHANLIPVLYCYYTYLCSIVIVVLCCIVIIFLCCIVIIFLCCIVIVYLCCIVIVYLCCIVIVFLSCNVIVFLC